MEQIRIQKVLSDNGVLSRRKAEEAIAAGRVTVNGHPCLLGQKIDPRRDLVALDGAALVLRARVQKVYLMLNKPRGFVTTLADEMGRRCVRELVEDAPAKVYPVGRLDKDSEGLLLFTNDGDFANYIMHPSHHVSKTYRVTIGGPVGEDALVALSAGVPLEDGATQPAQVGVLQKEPGRTVLQITIREGRNRQIRRMCEALGLPLKRLRRTSVGSLRLGMLAPGKWRLLTPAEVGALRGSVAAAPKGPAATGGGASHTAGKGARGGAAPKSTAPRGAAKPQGKAPGEPGARPPKGPARGPAPQKQGDRPPKGHAPGKGGQAAKCPSPKGRGAAPPKAGGNPGQGPGRRKPAGKK